MKVIVVTEAVVYGDSTAPVYAPDGADRDMLSLYLEVFDQVVVVARQAALPAPPGARRLDQEGISVVGLPAYKGVGGYLTHLGALGRQIRPLRRQAAAIVLRVPSPIASLVQVLTWSVGRPYAVEVVGDVWDVLAPGVVDVRWRPVLRALGTLETKRLCYWSAGASYVTRERLQRRYPVRAGTRGAESPLNTQYNWTLLPGPAAGRPATSDENELLFVGSLAQRYKGLDTLLNAVAILRAHGRDLRLRVVGDGRYRAELEGLARRLRIQDRVAFLGTMRRDEVAEEMAAATVLVLPSRTEGLPRVLLEAMAVGTPCIATAVGGVPELLPPSALVRPDDPAALADLIERALSSADLRRQWVEHGKAALADFRPEAEATRRRAFLKALHARTAAWLDRHPRTAETAFE